MNAKLIVVGGDTKAAEINLKLPTTIGRGRGVTLTLPHPLVSRKHCEIFAGDGTLFVRDLGSLNGTFVNNQRIEGDAELPSGELLTVGTVTFRAEYDDDPELRPPQQLAEKVEAKGSQTVRNPGGVTLEMESDIDAEGEINDEESAEFVAVVGIDEVDELGEDEDWEELDELEDVEAGEDVEDVEDVEDAEPIEDGKEKESDFDLNMEVEVAEDVRASKPAPDSSQPENDSGDDDDALNAFLKGLN